MKKLLLILIILLTGCTKTIQTINNQELDNNTIMFLKTNLSTSILIYNDSKTTLVELENKDKIYSNNNYKINNLVLRENIITDIDYDNKYILNNKLNINNINISITDKLLIDINNNKLCIYDKNIKLNGNYSICDYIYILNNEEEVFINLTEKTKALFYNEYKTFTPKFLEHIYITWIDTYIISNNSITKLYIDNEYKIENIKIT